MIPYLGDLREDTTVEIPWHSFDAGGASVTTSGFAAGDIKIYKDGGTSEKTSTNGITVTTDFDSRTGLHLIVVDTSNDTGDSGFWVTGSNYLVAVDAVTVDGQSLRFWAAHFSIENRVLARLPTALVGGRMDASVDATGMETGAIDAILQRQITEGYNTDGTAPTLEQAIMGIFQCLTEFSISGTTITVKQLDGSTSAMTFTLDSATDPTSRTRAS